MKVEFHDKEITKAEARMYGLVMRATMIYGQGFVQWIIDNLDSLYDKYKYGVEE